MRPALAAIVLSGLLMGNTAHAQSGGGFFGGMSQGMDDARARRDLDPYSYRQYRSQERMRQLMEENNRLTEENNRILRDQEYDRILHPRR